MEEHPLENEEVHVERLRNKRTYPGHLLPEDMVPKAFKVGTISTCLTVGASADCMHMRTNRLPYLLLTLLVRTTAAN